eukprot:7940463-Alexandrium_andersonii.AAC.1
MAQHVRVLDHHMHCAQPGHPRDRGTDWDVKTATWCAPRFVRRRLKSRTLVRRASGGQAVMHVQAADPYRTNGA